MQLWHTMIDHSVCCLTGFTLISLCLWTLLDIVVWCSVALLLKSAVLFPPFQSGLIHMDLGDNLGLPALVLEVLDGDHEIFSPRFW